MARQRRLADLQSIYQFTHAKLTVSQCRHDANTRRITQRFGNGNKFPHKTDISRFTDISTAKFGSRFCRDDSDHAESSKAPEESVLRLWMTRAREDSGNRFTFVLLADLQSDALGFGTEGSYGPRQSPRGHGQ